MNTDEKPGTVAFGLSASASYGILRYLGLLSDDSPSGGNFSVEILISNDYNPSDPAWLKLIDFLGPDEYGISGSISGSMGVGLGGHLGGTIKAYPNLSPEQIISPGDVEASVYAFGGGPIAVFDEKGDLTGGGALFGYGAGYEASLTVKSLGLTIDFEELTIKTVVNDTVRAYSINPFGKCFLPHTPITLADGTTKPIAAIRPGDMVLSPDKTGALVPARVTRTFVNDVAHVLDFHGTGVTPGHVFLCGAGRFQGRHVLLLDILRDDGAVVRQDGSLMRASTGCAVGSDGGPTYAGGDRLAPRSRRVRLRSWLQGARARRRCATGAVAVQVSGDAVVQSTALQQSRASGSFNPGARRSSAAVRPDGSFHHTVGRAMRLVSGRSDVQVLATE